MKVVILLLFFASILFGAESKKIYFYATDLNIHNFKFLKIKFDNYLQKYGSYEFQPFDDKETFENYLSVKNSTIMLSSWHFKQIKEQYNLKAKLIANKQNSITNKIILVGQKDSTLSGTVASAYDKKFATQKLNNLVKNKDISLLLVPKEIDALMSVGFGMSDFALVSDDSLELLKQINPSLGENLVVYKKTKDIYRMILSYNGKEDEKLTSIFLNINNDAEGKEILNKIAIDSMVVLSQKDLKKLGAKR